jgi:hypothetical protein
METPIFTTSLKMSPTAVKSQANGHYGIDHEGVPVGVSVTAGYYATFLHKKLRQKIRQNRPQLLESDALILHDNARPLIAQSVKDVMADYKWEVLPHLAYSPDMSPPNYDLFPKLKNSL